MNMGLRLKIVFAIFLFAVSEIAFAAEAEYLPRNGLVLPGILPVGAEYCTRSGKCKYVGSAENCVYVPAPKGDPCHDRFMWKFSTDKDGRSHPSQVLIDHKGTCSMQKVCQPNPDAGKELAAEVFIDNKGWNTNFVRIQGKIYATSGPFEVLVIHNGVRMNLSTYRFCFPPPGSTSTAIGGNPCPDDAHFKSSVPPGL